MLLADAQYTSVEYATHRGWGHGTWAACARLAAAAGVGKLIYRARPTVIPVRMLGMGEVLGVGCIIPRALKTVRVIIGRPLDTESLVASPLPEDVEGQVALYRQVSERVIQAIKDLTPTDESPPHILARLLGRCSRTP